MGKRSRSKVRKKLGYSEKLVRNVLIFSHLIVLSAIIYAYVFQEYSLWVDILDVVKILSPITISLFLWKAKGENIIKIRNNPDFDWERYSEELWEEWQEESKNE